MADSPITTPAQAQQIKDLSVTQFNTIRTRFGINDYPLRDDRTYIVFDAIAGDNVIHLATWNVRSYSIFKGDGSAPIYYNDTGGFKTLNYAVAGRYLITIDGHFHGIIVGDDFITVDQTARNKYIGLYLGTNGANQYSHDYGFYKCQNLEFVISKLSGMISMRYGFALCTKLKYFEVIAISEISTHVFEGCAILESVIGVISGRIQEYVFNGCTKLKNIDITQATQIDEAVFNNCASLDNIYITSAMSPIGVNCFDGCTGLIHMIIDYDASITLGSSSFTNVKLADLYVKGAANLTEAQAMETKLTTAGATLLTGYRLLY